MNFRWILLGLMVLLVLGATGWLLWAPEGPRPTVQVTIAPPPNVPAPTNKAVAPPTAPELPAAQTEAVDVQTPLDCRVPTGAIARIDARPVAAAAFCAELLVLTGGASPTATTMTRQQASALREQFIDAALVEDALNRAHAEITDAEVEAALAKRASPQLDDPALRAVVRGQLRRRLALARLATLAPSAPVTEDELRAEYDAHPEQWNAGGHVELETYLARPAAATSAASDAAQARALRFLQHRGEESDPVAARQEKLEHRAQVALRADGGETALWQATARLAPDMWTEPVRTTAGWVVARVIAVLPGEPRTLLAVRADVERVIKERRRVAAEASLARELRTHARVALLARW